MSDTVTIRVPMVPTRDVSPNGRVHWAKKHRAVKDLKNATMWTMRSVHYLDTLPELPWQFDYTVAWPKGAKRWDDDNLIAGLKPMRDAVAEEAGVDDRHITTGEVVQVRDKQQLGYVEITILGRSVDR